MLASFSEAGYTRNRVNERSPFPSQRHQTQRAMGIARSTERFFLISSGPICTCTHTHTHTHTHTRFRNESRSSSKSQRYDSFFFSFRSRAGKRVSDRKRRESRCLVSDVNASSLLQKCRTTFSGERHLLIKNKKERPVASRIIYELFLKFQETTKYYVTLRAVKHYYRRRNLPSNDITEFASLLNPVRIRRLRRSSFSPRVIQFLFEQKYYLTSYIPSRKPETVEI